MSAPPPPSDEPPTTAPPLATAVPSTDTIQAVSVCACVFCVGEGGGQRREKDKASDRTTVPSTSQFLEDNDRLIKAVQQCFAAGRLDDAARYSARLHANLTWLAAVADASPGGGGQ